METEKRLTMAGLCVIAASQQTVAGEPMAVAVPDSNPDENLPASISLVVNLSACNRDFLSSNLCQAILRFIISLLSPLRQIVL
jgi:hypothetical protein